MPREHPTLLALQGAYCVVAKLSRMGGPRGIRSSLAGPSNGFFISDEIEELAFDHVKSVAEVRDPLRRRILSLAMETGEKCRPVYTQRVIAKQLRMSRSTLRRELMKGLDELEDIFFGRECTKAA